MRLAPAKSLSRFMEAPVGLFWPGDSFFYWCASPTLFGFSLWARPPPQHFSAAFRKFTGLTPTQFRARKQT